MKQHRKANTRLQHTRTLIKLLQSNTGSYKSSYILRISALQQFVYIDTLVNKLTVLGLKYSVLNQI